MAHSQNGILLDIPLNLKIKSLIVSSPFKDKSIRSCKIIVLYFILKNPNAHKSSFIFLVEGKKTPEKIKVTVNIHILFI